MNWRVIAEFAGFQAVWLACAMGAAHGSSVPGLLAASTFIAVQLTRHRSRPVFLTMLASGIGGAFIESLLAGTGLVRYAASWPSPNLAPLWIIALWLAFGTTLATTANLLQQHTLPRAAVLGGVFGPLSYAAGAKLGALDIAAASWVTFGVIAGAWALSFPSLVALQRWLQSESASSRKFGPP